MQKFFQFKQFMVHQGRAAMPVTTDACIFGAIADMGSCKSVLDIGTGTGLLSLMLAQRFPEIQIHAVEKDKDSYYDAQKNFSLSPWLERLHLKHDDALKVEYVEPFEGIICNPPFFQDQLPSETEQKRAARHAAELNYQTLCELYDKHLAKGGKAWTLLPVIHESAFRAELEKKGMNVFKSVYIQASPKKEAHLVILGAGNSGGAESTEHFITYESQGFLSKQAQDLLHPFYLHLN